MKAEILCVGTELLLGDVINTNAAFLSRELAALGIDTYYHTVVGDNPQRLREQLERCFSRSDMVVMTGGLGPTYDDLTKETVAEYFSLPMVMDEHSLERIRDFFNSLKTTRVMTPNNEKQAMIPKGAVVFDNDNGTAPGIAVTAKGKTAILLPGPPKEVMPMFRDAVVPFLHELTGKVFVSHKINLFGIGESAAEAMLIDIMKDSSNPTLATYVGEAELYVRITAAGTDKTSAEELIAPYKEKVVKRLQQYIYAFDSPNIQTELVKRLWEKHLTIATAESITGGLISKRITDIPGSSEVFGMGVCTYSNEAKMQLLKVKKDTLSSVGAVSEQTALEMARGLFTLSGADVCVSVTGIAGPGGGTPEKPVGLVYVCAKYKEDERCVKLELGTKRRDRASVRSLTAAHAFKLVLDMIG